MLSNRALRRLRQILSEADYSAAITDQGDADVCLRRSDPASPLRTLLGLFHAGHSVSVPEALRLFESVLLNELIAAGILKLEGDSVVSAYRIAASDGLLFVHDPYPPQQRDHITGVNQAARTLATLTVRRPVRTALDICTGCGYQALLLSRHVEKVIATDILPRALWLTNLNAQINGISNIECREGNFFEPVRDERFDLVVCNPPFIISPDTDYVFRDGGLSGDAVSEVVLKSATEHLNEGGFATVLANWGLMAGQEWDEPGKKWLAAKGCDPVFIRWASSDPLSYAAIWNAHLRQLNSQDYAAALDRWVEYISSLHFETIAHVGVILRRRSGSTWTLSFEGIGVPSGDATDQIARIFSAQDFLAEHHGDLPDQHFALADGHRLDQSMTFKNGAYEIATASMSLPSGVGLQGEVPANLIPLLFSLATGTVGDLVTSLAKELDTDPEELRRNALTMVRSLFERGLLERLDPGAIITPAKD